jgi:hypothetical protein
MATNPSNTNAINIASLPQAQLLLDGDLLITETANGTQTIDFANLNLVKTDIFGNATIVGDLTGKNALLANVQVTSLSALDIFTPAGQGVNSSNDYYDRFTIQNGIVLSATRNTENNPVYKQITTSVIPATTGYLATLFRQVAEESGVATIAAGSARSTNIVLNNFFGQYPWIPNAGFITPSSFTLVPSVPSVITTSVIDRLAILVSGITPLAPFTQNALSGAFFNLFAQIPGLSAQPVIPVVLNQDIQQEFGTNLRFNISLAYPLQADVNIYWRLLVVD